MNRLAMVLVILVSACAVRADAPSAGVDSSGSIAVGAGGPIREQISWAVGQEWTDALLDASQSTNNEDNALIAALPSGCAERPKALEKYLAKLKEQSEAIKYDDCRGPEEMRNRVIEHVRLLNRSWALTLMRSAYMDAAREIALREGAAFALLSPKEAMRIKEAMDGVAKEDWEKQKAKK